MPGSVSDSMSWGFPEGRKVRKFILEEVGLQLAFERWLNV